MGPAGADGVIAANLGGRPGQSVTVPSGTINCPGVACFPVLGAIGLVSGTTAITVTAASERIYVTGDAIFSTSAQNGGTVVAGPCYQVGTAPWAYLNGSASWGSNLQSGDIGAGSAVGFFSTTTTPALVVGQTYNLGYCAQTNISATSGAVTASAKIVALHLR